MIFPLAGMGLGAIVGAARARSLGGKSADLVQWGAVGLIVGGLLGLFALIFIERAAL
ncbi:MAG: hypothetical protein ACU0BF_12780 [Paracoccaceae bacterium]